ncbi:hypothetical protein F2P45_32690 [Massilia sp. CCM 8733]|uniref:Bulb-type lectin domain-containing protein n=1 Tax=Massilia mucilaginosa TaxID=2609282 RepID=A0ABX0P4D0_9BURK|nr:hypothetical protein [Massilia mucilaginosa]
MVRAPIASAKSRGYKSLERSPGQFVRDQLFHQFWEKIMPCTKQNILGVCLACIATPGVAASTLSPNDLLQRGQYLQSPQGAYTLNMQSDGSLVMYRKDGLVRYRMSKNGEFALMQADGNFVEYSKFAVPLWSTGTDRNPGAWLSIQDDGNLVVYSRVKRAMWSGANSTPTAFRSASSAISACGTASTSSRPARAATTRSSLSTSMISRASRAIGERPDRIYPTA